MKILNSIRNAAQSHLRAADPVIELTADGFSISGHAFALTDITKVVGYKIDLLTVDEVRFELVLSTGEQITVCEEQPGFPALVQSLCEAFPSILGWEQKIVQPAFATNRTVLYVGT